MITIQNNIHQNTSIGVCHILSFRGDDFSCFIKTLFRFNLISFIYFACCHDSNLTFIASYKNNIAKENAKAKIIWSKPNSINVIVTILVTIPAWKEGNHQAAKIFEKTNFFDFIKSIRTLVNWIIDQTIIKINIGLILTQLWKYCWILSWINWNISFVVKKVNAIFYYLLKSCLLSSRTEHSTTRGP